MEKKHIDKIAAAKNRAKNNNENQNKLIFAINSIFHSEMSL